RDPRIGGLRMSGPRFGERLEAVDRQIAQPSVWRRPCRRCDHSVASPATPGAWGTPERRLQERSIRPSIFNLKSSICNRPTGPASPQHEYDDRADQVIADPSTRSLRMSDTTLNPLSGAGPGKLPPSPRSADVVRPRLWPAVVVLAIQWAAKLLAERFWPGE